MANISAFVCRVLTGVCLVALISTTGLAEEYKQKVVLELFTSQGCSSCPPADALLSEFAKRTNIVALTMPVDYWDHLGWKDTLAKGIFTKRQRAYAESWGDEGVYTPQIVVDGLMQIVGSHASEIEDAIQNTAATLHEVQVPVFLKKDGNSLELEVGATPEGATYHAGTLWIAFFTHSVSVDINRGENDGRRIVYTNVVRNLTTAGRWEGVRVNYHIAIPRGSDIDGCAAFLQADEPKAVLGAAIARFGRQ
jgi:hypothetical protein